MFNKFIVNITIVSFSIGLDSAIMSVNDTSVEFDIVLVLFLYNILFFAKNVMNKDAPILLQPSAKGWSFIKNYSRFAAFSSILGYISCPNAL